MKSFLHEYDLSEKSVIPFNTHAGYGVRTSFQTVTELCFNCTIQEGFSIKGGVEKDGVLFVMKGKKEKKTQIEVKHRLKKISLLH